MENLKNNISLFLESLPYGVDKEESFYTSAESQLRRYSDFLRSNDLKVLDEMVKTADEMCDVQSATRFLNLIDQINHNCLKALYFAYQGDITRASELLYKVLTKRTYTESKLNDYYINYLRSDFHKDEKEWYRIVKLKKNNLPSIHIPFYKRGLASNNRYNLAGHPCLYLADSIDCAKHEIWYDKENLRADEMYLLSTFKFVSPIRLLNFAIPTKEEIDKMDCYEIFCLLLSFPIIILCNAKAAEDDDKNGKNLESYLFSQLIIHVLLHDTNGEKTLSFFKGIRYSSVRYDKGINLMLPAKYARDNNIRLGICNKTLEHIKNPKQQDCDSKLQEYLACIKTEILAGGNCYPKSAKKADMAAIKYLKENKF